MGEIISGLEQLPFFQSYDPIAKQLTLRDATYFPRELFEFASEIEILDAAHGQLTSLPDDFGRLTQLRIAFFSDNPFTELPTVLADCAQLTMVGFKSCQLEVLPENALPPTVRWLTLTDNHLRRLPESIGQLTKLQKCLLTGNQLQALPDTMQACTDLELLRLAANNFNVAPPDWLWSLPRLAWYGDAGNPFCPTHTMAAAEPVPVTDIAWSDVTLHDQIGESPSSTVYRATLRQEPNPVAVKLYKAKLASDGKPEDDRAACLAAGAHASLIPVVGRLLDHPAGLAGLVLALVPESYTSLGLPPSFSTCTRDTFLPNTNFTPPYIKRVLQQMASVLQQLHQRGIMHGDVYAHNILTNASGESFLGDFGAASFYNPAMAAVREQIDVRAFGCLIDDLLQHSSVGGTAALQDLRALCLQPTVAARPRFAEISELLQ